MRDAIAGAWLYSIVVVFMMILVGFIAISINYNKTYKLKTTVVNLIEQHQGLNSETVDDISGYLSANGYTNGKVCRTLFKNDNQKYVEINKGVASSVKIKKDDKSTTPSQVCVTRSKFDLGKEGTAQLDYSYDVYMFFSFSLPVFGDVFRFTVTGSTNAIHYPIDTYAW